MINFKKMGRIKEDDKYNTVDKTFFNFRKGFRLALEAFSIFGFLKIGGDRFRRDKRDFKLHAEDYSLLQKHLLQQINADYGYMAAA